MGVWNAGIHNTGKTQESITQRECKHRRKFSLEFDWMFFSLCFIQHRNPFLWKWMYLSFNPNSNLQNIFTGMHSFEIPLEFPQSKQALKFLFFLYSKGGLRIPT